MPSAVNDIILAQRACARIGHTPIEDFSEETIGGESCQLIYDGTLEMCLDAYPWTWAQSAVQLTKTAEVSKLGHLYVYQMPGDRIGGPQRLLDDITDEKSTVTLFALEVDRIHASVDPLYGVFKIKPDPSIWPGAFREVFVTALASRFAVAIAADKGLADSLWVEAFGNMSEQMRGGLMGAAIRADSRASPVRSLPHDQNPFLASWMR